MDLKSIFAPEYLTRARNIATQMIPPRESASRAADFVEGAANGDSSPAEVPLTEIGGEHLVDVHVDTAQKWTGIRRAIDHLLIQHRGGRALSMRPAFGLPRPVVPCSGGLADHAVTDCPAARLKCP